MSVFDIVRQTALGNNLLNSRWYFLMREKRKILDVIKRMGYEHVVSKQLIEDMVDERRLNRVPYDEYFLFDFTNRTQEERRKFITDVERVEIANRLNNVKNDPIFYDKSITYQYYRDFYHRDVISLDAFDTEEFTVFFEFVQKHSAFICKPVDGGCGTGIHIFKMDGRSAEEMFADLKKQYNSHIVVEELVVQQETMGQLHPSSVNTVRVPTIRFDDRVELIHPFLRVGRGDSVTDNAGSGGIICALDAETGTVVATADEFGNTYETHPDSGVRLLGFTVPEWDKAKELVKQLALIVPDNRYSSWDIALTDQGWVMIEVNARGQFLWQYATKEGFRAEVETILEEIQEKG